MEPFSPLESLPSDARRFSKVFISLDDGRRPFPTRNTSSEGESGPFCGSSSPDTLCLPSTWKILLWKQAKLTNAVDPKVHSE